jgi:type I restriction enzyme S subunit
MNSDSAVPGLNRNAAHSLKIKVPDLDEQKRIAHILGTLDDKIELNQRMNETLEAIARAIFKSWFVDFDPVKAKMSGEPYPLPDAVMALFPDELVESELGLIPRGWEVSTINDEIELVGGGTPSTRNPKYWENGIYNFATPKDLSNLSSIFLLDTDRKVTPAGLNKISSGLLEPGTLLMSSRAPVGYLAINQIPVCINQGFIAMKCNKRLTANYMLNWAKTHMEEIKSLASGTTFSELSKRNFRPMKILVPSQEIIIAFNDYISTIFDQISLNLEMNKNLVCQRESLLDQLI